MLLTIDIGNTETAVGLYRAEELLGHWRLTTDVDRTPDETRLWLRSLLEMEGYEAAHIPGVALSSVVPAVTASFRSFAQRLGTDRVVVVEPGVKTGMPIMIDNPREVGADRVVNAVAARERLWIARRRRRFRDVDQFRHRRRRRGLSRRRDRSGPRHLDQRAHLGNGGPTSGSSSLLPAR